ncbi:flagellar basal body P-ring protein FlgI [Roseibium alexandrii]|uniref:Flagellar P-ring protein n=1 Tax=Roseibium alexandrii (strain DSM 17067 / NCIMB 14079 / DFL-11) TaxID=244592 RepID=A0A5E8GUK0_ROSAD|nr:flagellar basal body P-ring protein FlgI [Roseibium alexandrii]EEE43610.1 Flagellar basal-body P-ring protein [Roseibium alexandrii DFL-11]
MRRLITYFENRATRVTLVAAALVGLQLAIAVQAVASSRIKDIADFEGIRENQLIGYGLVVGLNGTGDSLNNTPFTQQSLQAMLERLGVNTRNIPLNTDTVAAVMVTANLPPFSTQGTRIDVSVSALGDASSLQGGTLLVTPLVGADGEVYAIAQGSVAIGGFSAQGDAASIVRGVPTAGRIANGGLVERELDFKLASLTSVRLALRNPDLTTARRVALSINELIGMPTAEPVDPATVQLELPRQYDGNIVDLLTDIEQLIVEPDLAARVIIDENSGIIVMGQDVKVSMVAVAQGNLTVTIAETPEVVQPLPFANGQTAIAPRTDLNVNTDPDAKLAIVPNTVTLKQLVDGLNALGIGPRDMISILQAIKASGALQAEIEVL